MKMNKRGKATAAALLISSSLILFNTMDPFYQAEKKEAAATYDYFKVQLVNENNEVYSSSLKDSSGLYLDQNRNNFKVNDIIRASFDSDGDIITTEKVSKYLIIKEEK